MSDAELAAIQGLLDRLRLAGEEKGAGDELFRLVYGRLEGMTRKLKRFYPGLDRWEDTQAVLQEAALRLWRKVRDEPPATARAFFGDASRKIRDTLIDLLRHFYGAEGPGGKVVAGSDGGGDLPERGSDTYDPALLEELTDLHRQVQALPDAEREVFELVWYQELSQPQVADLLGVSLRTVKLRWQAARVRLGQWLRD
jgi:RNA polymerase sigma-70 factor (ECF subfamily)